MSLITGKVANGKFVPDYPEYFKAEFNKREGKDIKIEVSSIGEKAKKYAYLYGVVYKVFRDELGYSSLDEVDSDLKNEFLVDHAYECRLTGEVGKRVLRKRDVSPEVLSKYISDCVLFGNSNYGFNIPAPDEAGQISQKEAV